MESFPVDGGTGVQPTSSLNAYHQKVTPRGGNISFPPLEARLPFDQASDLTAAGNVSQTQCWPESRRRPGGGLAGPDGLLD